MILENKNVLITGAGGFIGSHLVEELVNTAGCNVKAFIHYNSRNYWGLVETLPEPIKDNIEIVTGDIQDPYGVKNAMKDVDVVFHLAALIGIPYSYISPESYINTNIKGTLNVLKASLDCEVDKVIHTSTSETYGSAQYTPIDEKHPLVGQSPYSASKIGADKIAESFYNSFDLPVATIRPFNTYGPRQSARAVIPTIISQALFEKSIQIGSLGPVRDLNFVKDTIDGFIKIAENNSAIGEVINIGSGSGISIGDLIGKILDILELDTPVIPETQRIRPDKSEVKKLICDNRKARELIGWKPQYSLDQGLKLTIEWIQKNPMFYKSNIYNV
ncbi:MAG: SDR family NAD(P)-dependent oxidoreductase [Methanosarcina sp.]